MRLLVCTLLVAILSGCAQTNYQAYEGRTDQIIEGQGGTKQVIDGIEVWDNGNPPRRYKVLGVATVEHFDTAPGNAQIRSAIAAQVKEAKGDAAIMMDWSSTGQSTMTTTTWVAGKPMFGVGTNQGRKTVRVQIVQYLGAKP